MKTETETVKVCVNLKSNSDIIKEKIRESIKLTEELIESLEKLKDIKMKIGIETYEIKGKWWEFWK